MKDNIPLSAAPSPASVGVVSPPAQAADNQSGKAPHTAPDSAAPDGRHLLRPRTWIVGLPLLVGLSVLSVYADMSAQVIQFGVLQFSPPAVVALFGLALVNIGWRRMFRKVLFNGAEMLAIYAMLLVGVMVSTRGIVEKLAGSIAYLPYGIVHQYPEFRPFLSHIPAWMVPYNPALSNVVPEPVRKFYESGRTGVPWTVWWGPLAADFALFALVALVFLCMGTILRRQWVDVEHLSFPLTSIPIALIKNESNGAPLLSHPLLWAGFAVPVIIFGLNGLHANYPVVPQFPTMIDLQALLVVPPWNQVGYFRAFLSLAVVGFAYFMPSDILFSLWFFYLLLKLQTVAAPTLGYPANVSGAWPPYEALGAYLVLAASMMWQARQHLARVWQTAFPSRHAAASSGTTRLDDTHELMPYRAAVLGLFVGLAGILAWLWHAGMNPLLAAVEMGVYLFVTAFVMSRAVAQAGLLMTETSFVPLDLIQLACPVAALGAAGLTMTAVMNTWFSRDLRGELLAPILDTQRTAGAIGERPRTLLLPLLVAIPVAFVVASATFLHLSYGTGALNLYYHPIWSTSREFAALVAPLHGHSDLSSVSPGAAIIGGAVTLFMVGMRARFPWFPFHPLGFALAPTWALTVFWFGFLVAWVIRSLVLRYGGLRMYRALTPFMLGLIIGEFSMAVFWAVMHMAFRASSPEFPWP